MVHLNKDISLLIYFWSSLSLLHFFVRPRIIKTSPLFLLSWVACYSIRARERKGVVEVKINWCFFMSGSLNVSAPWVCGLNTNANCYIMNERFTQGIKISSWPLLHHHLISGTRTSWAWRSLRSRSPSASTFRILKLAQRGRETCFVAFTIMWNASIRDESRFIARRVMWRHCSYTHMTVPLDGEMMGRSGEIQASFQLTTEGQKTNTGFWLVNLMNKSLSMTPLPTTHTSIHCPSQQKLRTPPLCLSLYPWPLAHLLPLHTLAHIHVAVHYIVSRCALGLCQQKLNSSEKINIILLHYPFKTHANYSH